jgi:hypothetical protein
MADVAHSSSAKGETRWRIARWTFALALLLLPLAAMQFTDEVAWTPLDFAFFGAMLLTVGVVYEIAAWRAKGVAYRAAVGLALAAAFVLVWAIGAVGVIDGSDGLYLGVFAVAIGGAAIARFRARGMAIALVATALAQAAVTVYAIAAGLVPAYNTASQMLAIGAFFVALWLASAWLFGRAARGGARRAPA